MVNVLLVLAAAFEEVKAALLIDVVRIRFERDD